MTVFDATTIDNVSTDEAKGQVRLGLVIPGPFEPSPRLLQALGSKVSTYVAYVTSGQLAAAYPPVSKLEPWIEIVHAGELDDRGLGVIRQIAEQVQPHGIGVATLRLDVGGTAL